MKNSGKVVAITGAARGIGKACAVRFLSDGASVVISDVDGAALAETARELGHADRLRTVEADVSKRADVD
ncbi:dehydrogenase, partial [Streptomyces sp. Alain-F2R5]